MRRFPLVLSLLLLFLLLLGATGRLSRAGEPARATVSPAAPDSRPPAPMPAPPRDAAGVEASGIAALRTALEGGGPHVIDVKARVLSFPAGPGRVFLCVPFVLSPSRPAGGALEIVAGLLGQPEAKLFHAAIMSTPARAQDADDTAAASPVLSYALVTPPGTYRIVIAAREPGQETVLGGAVVPVETPVFDDGKLHMTKAIFARKVVVDATGGAVVDRVVAGIRIGNLTLDAGIDNRVKAGSTPEVVYFIGGAEADAKGEINIAADYRILRGVTEVVRFPTQTIKDPVTDQPIPMKGLTPGEYRLEVTLVERASKRTVSDSIDFRLE